MNTILYPAPVYGFLAFLSRQGIKPQDGRELRILDCGAGGAVPPLALFADNGFNAFGIDIAQAEIDKARAFGKDHSVAMNITHGDMRSIPFADNTFDCLYEYHSMGHISKHDTDTAIREMYRVLKPGGFCFLGFMMNDTWPILGKDNGNGEYALVEGGEHVVHSVYKDGEPDAYFGNWDIVLKEKLLRWYTGWSQTLSLEEWKKMFADSRSAHTAVEVAQMFEERVEKGNYTHTFYTVQKPRE